MDINYWGVGLFIAVMVALIIWLIKRNRKDEKTFEKDIIQSELKPEDDNDHDEKLPDNL
jgi:putative exporter of polyketide antibiotics